jgi:16S rRNA (guanine966-N2)-methyltransferase
MRITGGRFRSRLLTAPAGNATRPTSDRVREGLFGILAAAGAIEGRCVLDLYAGTGALGLEALSRGAERATFVESRREALAALRANIDALSVGASAKVVAATVSAAAARLAPLAPFDLVFADPPWALVDSGQAPRAVAALVAAGLFADDSWVIVEHSARGPDPAIEGLIHAHGRRYGDATLAFYKTGILGRPRGVEGARFPFE